jgi:uncharacterized phage protein gp47/JayE
MMPAIDATGIHIQTFEEAYTELADALKAVYGADINLEQSTPDGQKVGIETKLSLDLQTAAVELYNQMDPDFATGQSLNRIIKICGIRRKPATRSSVDAEIVTEYDLTLPSGYIVQDQNNQNWITTESQFLTQGDNTVTLYAEDWGNVEAEPNTITKPVTIILGVQSVTNTLSATSGSDEETDEELRIRRNRSLENAAYSTIGNLYAKLADLPGVTNLMIYENRTNEHDADLDLDGHSIWVIVQGGSVSDIVEAIAINKTGGTGLKGTENGLYVESLIKPDGSTFQFYHDMQFDRPTLTPLYVQLNVRRKVQTVPIDAVSIQNAVAATVFDIAETALTTSLYSAVYSAGKTFIPFALEISRDGVTWEDESISAGYAEMFTIDADNVTVTEVV